MKILFFLSIITIGLVNHVLAGIQIGLAEPQKLVSTNGWGAVVYNTKLSIGLAGGDHEIKTNQPNLQDG
jgi:hypothetical protein